MTANRPYQRAYQVAEAVRELRENAGSQFDPDIVRIFIAALGDEDVDNKKNEWDSAEPPVFTGDGLESLQRIVISIPSKVHFIWTTGSNGSRRPWPSF